jgi:hypothetical protein
MYIYTYYSIKILDKKVPTLKEIPRSAPECFFHTVCESYCFTPPLKDKPVIPGLLFQFPLSL